MILLLIGLRKSTPPPNRQLVVNYYQSKYQVDDFVGELTFLNYEYILSNKRASGDRKGAGEQVAISSGRVCNMNTAWQRNLPDTSLTSQTLF